MGRQREAAEDVRDEDLRLGMRTAMMDRSPADAWFWRGCADGCIDRRRRGQRWGGRAGKAFTVLVLEVSMSRSG